MESSVDLMKRICGRGSEETPSITGTAIDATTADNSSKHVTTDAQGMQSIPTSSSTVLTDSQTNLGNRVPESGEQTGGMIHGMVEKVKDAISSVTGTRTDEQTAPYMTSMWGQPAPDLTHCANIGGYPIVSDTYLFELQQNFNRQKTLERAVHACGSGGFGYFECTNDLTQYCSAEFMNKVRKRTPLAARFSTVTYGREFPDSARNPRGLAFKLYTEQGNYDILSVNFPVFFVRDPILGPSLIRSQQRSPINFQVNFDATMDFMSLVPESMLANLWYWSDHGTPKGWRFMDGYPDHTFRWVNSNTGAGYWVKYKFQCDAGIQNFSQQEAIRTCGEDPDYAKRDLFQHLADGGTASWTWLVQIMPEADADTYRFDIRDNTKVWPVEDYPYHELGKIVINKNPENFHRDIEQLAFSPGRLVPGIESSPDPLLQFRMFLYQDAQLHRLGANYHQIPVNFPYRAKQYHPLTRDGALRVDSNGGCEPHYYPNSATNPPHPIPSFDLASKSLSAHTMPIVTGTATRTAASKHESNVDDDFIQCRWFYNNQLSGSERHHLHYNIAFALLSITRYEIGYRFLVLCEKVSSNLVDGIINEFEKLKIEKNMITKWKIDRENIINTVKQVSSSVDRSHAYVPVI